MTDEIEPTNVEVEVEAAPEIEDAGDPIRELQAQKSELEAKLHQATGRAAQAERVAQNSYGQQIDQNLATLEAASNAAREKFAHAMESGEWSTAAAAQSELADLRARFAQWEQERVTAQARQQQTPADPVEAFCRGRSAQSAAWVRAHADYITDPAKFELLQGAHHLARGAGHAADTPAYFEAIERTLDLRGGKQQRNESGQVTRRATAPVAPVSHSSIGAGMSGPRTVKLTAGQAQAAVDGTHTWKRSDLAAGRIKDASVIGQPIGRAEFARRVAAMRADGRMSDE